MKHGRRKRTRAAGLGPRVVAGAVLTLAGLLGLRFLTASDGYPALLALRSELVTLQEEVRQLHRDNRHLEDQIASLRNDPYAVEKIAREDLDLVAPGEILYLFPGKLGPPAADTLQPPAGAP